MDIDFDCTLCGNCCRDLKIPLSVDEAINWMMDGNQVQIITEAVPWPDEPEADDKQTLFKRERSFAVMSGALPTRVAVVLVASFSGACPNLGADQRCGIYERRPLVCRIYPAEANNFSDLIRGNKMCPPEAWTPGRNAFVRRGQIVSPALQEAIAQSHAEAIGSVARKQSLCASFGIDSAALVNEGLVLYVVDQARLLAELQQSDADAEGVAPAASPGDWRYVTNRQTTVDVLNSVGASSTLVSAGEPHAFTYLGYYPAPAQMPA